MHDLLEGASTRRGSGGRRRETIQQGQRLGDSGLQHRVKLNGDSRAWCN